MREIKFRGMDISDCWHYGMLSKKDNRFYISNRAGMAYAYEVRTKTVGQYTCLKDINGKEIYEGDIVRLPEDEDYKYYSIIYSKNRLGFTLSNGCGFGLSYGIEVVGNIYENPELLEVQND